MTSQQIQEAAKQLVEKAARVLKITRDRAFSSEDLNTASVHCIMGTGDTERITMSRELLRQEGFAVIHS